MLAKETDDQLRLEIIRTLATLSDEKVARNLLQVAQNATFSVPVRAEALLALSRQPGEISARVIPLLEDAEADIRLEAVRYLRTQAGTETVKQALQQKYNSLSQEPDQGVKEQLIVAMAPEKVKRPASLDKWQTLLASGGNAERGRRVIYAVQSMCSMCHAVEGRGGDLGPDLTNIGKSKIRSQLVHAILRPSEEINPEYQGWFIRMKNGESHQGRQIDIGEKSIELYTHGSGFITVAKNEVADYGIHEKSLMPDGLENYLTESELRDLIAFLEGV